MTDLQLLNLMKSEINKDIGDANAFVVVSYQYQLVGFDVEASEVVVA